MSNQSIGERVLERLAQAAQSGLLPAAAQVEAEKLLARLKIPVRLALLGMPGSGKSSLLNLLAGEIVLPEGVRLPTVQLSYGPESKAICTLSDGTKQTLAAADCHEIAALSPVFVEIELPLPALSKISLLETVAPNDPNALHRAGQWAAKRADVVLWCTSEFDKTERRIWGQMPDLIKDYALLMITRMDILQDLGTLNGVIGSIRTAAIGEFEKILPINVPMALEARKPDGSVDKKLMRDSGGMALIGAVLKQVDQERRSATDMADVLLLQNAGALSGLDEAKTPAAPANAPAVKVDEAVAAKSEPEVSAGIARLREIAARRAAEQAQTTGPATLQPDTRAVYQHVVDRLEDRAKALTVVMQDMGDDAPSEIMDECVTQIQWLCDYLNDNGDAQYEPLQRARDTAFDAADLVQLMQLEKRDSAALEAVSLMLQVKRELQADLAA
jgi:energy-coupling factor transporter ATP-binding protein EcfA2